MFYYIITVLFDCRKIKSLLYLRLEVHRINSLRPGGGGFFNSTKSACNVRLEYLGPIEP